MATARDYVLNALVDIGIHATTTDVPADDATRGLRILNRVLKEWNGLRLLKYSISQGSYTTSNAQFSIGPGLNINVTPRPVDIVGVYYTQGSERYPLQRMTTIDLINQGSESGTPIYFAYNPTSSVAGAISVYPTPGAAYTYTVSFGTEFTTGYGINDSVDIPGEYEALLESALCAEYARAWGFPRPDMDMKYEDLKRAIRAKNVSFGKMELSANLRV